MFENKLKEREDYQRLILDHLKDDCGYIVRNSKNFIPLLAMDEEILFKFLWDTQKEQMLKLQEKYNGELQVKLRNYIATEIRDRGIIDVLKKGIKDSGTELLLMFRKPATTFNSEATELYKKNLFSVMQEVYHKDRERIDLVIFINGLAIITFELKCNTSGQNYKDAIYQYKNERDYKTRLFTHKIGAVVNFAMDLEEVYMCTNLKGRESIFLPFNKGKGNGKSKGKGNPVNSDGIAVSYMWEDILTKDTLLYLLDKFIYVKKEKKKQKSGKYKTVEVVIFPRYHQLDALRTLTKDIIINKLSNNYLIEHSAGSGKTNTIAWLAHRLASLYDNDERVIFDTVVIITDRTVVDRQLQDAVTSLEHKAGLVKIMNDDCKSTDLADALNGNTKIVVSTIQKFRFIPNLDKTLSGKKFAIIIDEAHSSTSGSNMEAVTSSLVVSDEDELADLGALIESEINKNGKQSNISMIAFTATPKPTTLSMFGTDTPQGGKEAFHLYSMKQAIEEGFIFDVLDNYVTYKTYFEINKIVNDDPVLQTAKGKKAIARSVELDDTNIAQKIEIIVEHFKNSVMHKIGGEAKAMVVTSSREAAIKYTLEFNKYIKKKNYDGIKALVAFTGSKTIDGKEYTEKKLNGFSETELPDKFDNDEYKVLLVADKYQTGFDQPKLQAMYVDKKLKGVTAVQTLSRLNRICAKKDSTFILDFKNSYEEILKAFAPFYEATILTESLNPNDIYKLERKIDEYKFLDLDDIEIFINLVYKQKMTNKDKEKAWALTSKALSFIKDKEDEDQLEIRTFIKKFIRFYAFMIQACMFEDVQLHKKFIFMKYLVNEIEVGSGNNNIDLTDKIAINHLSQKKIEEITKSKVKADSYVELAKASTGVTIITKEAHLSEIIEEINLETGKNLDAKVMSKSLMQIYDILLSSADLETSAKNNALKDFKLKFGENFDDVLVDGLSQNQEFFTLLLTDNMIKQKIIDTFLEDAYKDLRSKGKAYELDYNQTHEIVAEDDRKYGEDKDTNYINADRVDRQEVINDISQMYKVDLSVATEVVDILEKLQIKNKEEYFYYKQELPKFPAGTLGMMIMDTKYYLNVKKTSIQFIIMLVKSLLPAGGLIDSVEIIKKNMRKIEDYEKCVFTQILKFINKETKKIDLTELFNKILELHDRRCNNYFEGITCPHLNDDLCGISKERVQNIINTLADKDAIKLNLNSLKLL